MKEGVGRVVVVVVEPMECVLKPEMFRSRRTCAWQAGELGVLLWLSQWNWDAHMHRVADCAQHRVGLRIRHVKEGREGTEVCTEVCTEVRTCVEYSLGCSGLLHLTTMSPLDPATLSSLHKQPDKLRPFIDTWPSASRC